jgi:hypothetical protein
LSREDRAEKVRRAEMSTEKHQSDSKRETDGLTGQLRYDDIQSRVMSDLLLDDTILQLEKSIDPVVFLRTLRLSHGLISSRYSVAKDENGSPLIICGSRRLRLIEFLKYEMHFSAEVSGRIIRGEQTSMDLVGHKVSPYELKLRSSKWECETWYVSVDNPEEAHAVMRFLNAVERNRGEDFNIVFLRVIEVPYPLHVNSRAQRRGEICRYAMITAPIEAISDLQTYGYPVSVAARIIRGRDLFSENRSHNGDWKWAAYTQEIIKGDLDWAANNLTCHENGKYWVSWVDIQPLLARPSAI